MSGYTAMPTETYALVHDAVAAQYAGREWPEALVELHLRWLVGEYKRGALGPGRRDQWPTTRELGALVGWRSTDRVARFVSREVEHLLADGSTVTAPHWMDPYQVVALADLRGDRLVGINRRRTADGRETDGARTARTEQRRESEHATDGRRTGDGRETDAVRDSLRAGTTVPGTEEGGSLARDPPCQPWVPEARVLDGHDRRAVEALVLGACEELRQAPVNPAECATDAAEVLGLWRTVGRPDPAVFLVDLRQVIAWARLSPDRLAARDIRGEGWEGAADRHRSMGTICVRRRWSERLEAARAWHRSGCPESSPEPLRPNGRAPPGRFNPASYDPFAEDPLPRRPLEVP